MEAFRYVFLERVVEVQLIGKFHLEEHLDSQECKHNKKCVYERPPLYDDSKTADLQLNDIIFHVEFAENAMLLHLVEALGAGVGLDAEYTGEDGQDEEEEKHAVHQGTSVVPG